MTFRLFILLFISACGKLNYSPYEINIDSTDSNAQNLQRIFAHATALETKTSNYSFAVISDTHDYYDGLKKQINYINRNYKKFDFVIITGDLSNVGLVSEFEATKDILDKLIPPYLTLIGNHDLLIDGEKIYKEMFGSLNYSFEYKNTKFVLFNNNNWESSKEAPNLNWLENSLVSTNKLHRILLSHVAPDDADRFTKSEINSLQGLVDRYGVSYYINGHNHNPGDGYFGNANQVTVGSSSKDVLLEVNVDNLGVSHEFINL
jgi:predicted phosphodiesterase